MFFLWQPLLNCRMFSFEICLLHLNSWSSLGWLLGDECVVDRRSIYGVCGIAGYIWALNSGACG